MKCILCGRRKAKRYCPAKNSSICPICCGEKRGVEINCPLDCQYYVEGQKYQQDKILKHRIKSEGVSSYVRRAELYNENPKIFVDIEYPFVDLFRSMDQMKDSDLASAFQLVLDTLKTEEKGLIYEHTGENRVANEISKRILNVIKAHKDSAEVGRIRITLGYAIRVVEEFLNEIKFFIETNSNPQAYLIHISRYHPDKSSANVSMDSSLIIQP